MGLSITFSKDNFPGWSTWEFYSKSLCGYEKGEEKPHARKRGLPPGLWRIYGSGEKYERESYLREREWILKSQFYGFRNSNVSNGNLVPWCRNERLMETRSSSCLISFLKEPQTSLRFKDADEDRVHSLLTLALFIHFPGVDFEFTFTPQSYCSPVWIKAKGIDERRLRTTREESSGCRLVLKDFPIKKGC